MSKEEFVKMMTADLPEAPGLLSARRGDQSLGRAWTFRAATTAGVNTATGFATAQTMATCCSTCVRAADFGAGHVPGSMNIGLGGQFAMWAGSLIPLNASIVIIADTGAQVDESVVRLARVGIENVKGYLEGGVQSWRDAGLPVDAIPQVSVAELNERLANSDLQIVDVRRPAEYVSGHVPRALNAPLATLDKSLGPLSSRKTN